MNSQKIKDLSLQIDKLKRLRDEELGSIDLESDLSLETNVKSMDTYYNARQFKELANTAAMVFQLCKAKSVLQKTFESALNEHASMPPGIKIPHFWNPPENSYFRYRVPIVISAMSGVGKSTLARNIVVNNIMRKIPTVYVTNEDTMAEALIGIYTIHVKLNTGSSLSFQEVEMWLHETKKGNPKYKELSQNVHRFSSMIKKYLAIIEAPEWSMSSILLGIERCENEFGEPVQCAILDYVQLVEPESRDNAKEIRHQMIAKSRMWKNYAKTKNIVPIIISQLNDDGRTAESTQFEKDAGQWFTIERERDKDTEQLSEMVTIKVKKGRRTGTGKMECAMDGKSGAFIHRPGWCPPKENLYAD